MNMIKKYLKKDKILSDIKKLLSAFGQFSDHDHAILINEFNEIIVLLYQNMLLRKLNKSRW